LLRVEGAIEIHVEPSLYSLFYGGSACWNLIQDDIVRATFVTDVVPLQHFVNIRFPNIARYTINKVIRSTITADATGIKGGLHDGAFTLTSGTSVNTAGDFPRHPHRLGIMNHPSKFWPCRRDRVMDP